MSWQCGHQPKDKRFKNTVLKEMLRIYSHFGLTWRFWNADVQHIVYYLDFERYDDMMYKPAAEGNLSNMAKNPTDFPDF